MRNSTADQPIYLSTTDLAERTWRACTDARQAVRTAEHLLHTCRTTKEEWEHWRILRGDRIANPEHFISCCTYCSRMRTPTQEWVAIPIGVRMLLQHRNVPFLSHGICPECLDSLISP